MKLALGSAQFGLNYGVSNESGKVAGAEVKNILSYARGVGIQTLDTAISYGDSESILGDVGVAGWQVITKLPPVPAGEANIGSWVEQQINASLGRLGLTSVYGLLLHRPDQLLGSDGRQLAGSLERLKEKGLAKKVGISIYQPEQLDGLEGEAVFDIVQAPCNIFDRRLIESGWLSRLKDRGVEVHARSVFLQGLLLMPASLRPPRFDRWERLFRAWDNWLAECEVSPVKACVDYVQAIGEIDRVVVGVESRKQLELIVGALLADKVVVPEYIKSTDIDLIDPSRW